MSRLLKTIVFTTVVTLSTVVWGQSKDTKAAGGDNSKGTYSAAECKTFIEHPPTPLNEEEKKKYQDCSLIYTRANQSDKVDDAKRENCKDLKSAIKTAKEAFDKSCKEAGGGTCDTASVVECENELGSELYSGMNAISQSLGVNTTSVVNKCARMAGEDYFSTKKDLEGDLKTLNSELNQAQKDFTSEQETFNKESSQLKTEIQDNQKAFDAKVLELKQTQREKVAALQKQQTDQQEQTTKITNEITSNRNALSNEIMNLNAQMIQVSEAAGKRSCLAAVKKSRDAYASTYGAAAAGSIQASNDKRQSLQDEFDQCLAGVDLQRQNLINNSKQRQESINTTISNLQDKLDSVQKSSQLLQQQIQEQIADNNNEKQSAYNDLLQRAANAQQKLLQLQQTTAQKQAADQEKIQSLRQQIYMKQNELNTLGPVPSGGRKSTKTMSDVAIDKSAKDEAVSDYITTCCPNLPNSSLNFLGLDDKDCQSATKKTKTDSNKGQIKHKNNQ